MIRSRSRRILVVDDDRLVRMNARLVLEREGWTVDEAADCGSAIAFLETRDYDLVVCDVALPDGNGLDVVRRTTEISPGTAVLVMTASETGLTFEAVAAAGAAALLRRGPRARSQRLPPGSASGKPRDKKWDLDSPLPS